MSLINPVVFNLKERKMGKTSINIDLRGLLIKTLRKIGMDVMEKTMESQ
jgi:hypothetical protein